MKDFQENNEEQRENSMSYLNDLRKKDYKSHCASIKKIADHFGKNGQLNKFKEEVFELLEACMDYDTDMGNIEHIEEEIADVLIVLEQLCYLYNVNILNINKNVCMKLKRTEKRILEGYYDK